MEGKKAPESWFGNKLKTELISAAYAAYKKLKRVGALFDPRVESLHTPSREFNWNESFYFNFTDAQNRIGGWTRLGILPNQESDNGAIALYTGGNHSIAASYGGKTEAEGGKLRLGPIEYHCLEPLNKWKITFQGDMFDVDGPIRLHGLRADARGLQKVEIDLCFEGISPCFDFEDAHPRAIAEMLVEAGTRLRDLRQAYRIASAHYEQVGQISGMIKIEDRVIPLQGSGHRDHSWGPRDWSAPRLWAFLTCRFGNEFAFNLSRVAIASVDVLNGFITRDQMNYPLRRAALKTEFESDGVTQKRLWFEMEDSGGKIIEITGDVLAVVSVEFESGGNRTLVNEALTEYRFKDTISYGISEYLHQVSGRKKLPGSRPPLRLTGF